MAGSHAPLPWRFRHLFRRGGAPGAPASLLSDELFINETDTGGPTIYAGIGDDGSGNSTSQVAIGGSGAFVDKSSAQTISGAKTFAQPVSSQGFSVTGTFGVSLAMGSSGAIRDSSDGGGMYFDVAAGSAAGGTFYWRNSNNYNTLMTLSANLIQHYQPVDNQVGQNYNATTPPTSGRNAFLLAETENLNLGSTNFHTTMYVQGERRTGASGFRVVGGFQQFSYDAGDAEQMQGVNGTVQVMSGGGAAFGANFVASLHAGVTAGSAAIGIEVDVVTPAGAVNGKKGIQIIDLGDANGTGSVDDAGLVIAKGSSSRGFANGIIFGLGGPDYANTNGVASGGVLINADPVDVSFSRGVDLSRVTFTDGAFVAPVTSDFRFGESAEGGKITSSATSNTGALSFGNNVTTLGFDGALQHQFTPSGYVTTGGVKLGSFTVATLPAGANGTVVYASDARKSGEAAGAGTGQMGIYSNGAWRDAAGVALAA